MKHLVLVCILLSACTITKATLDASPRFKVGDTFNTDGEFYLGKGVLRVTATIYGACFGVSDKLQWFYYTTMIKPDGGFIDDVQVCESDLK